MSNRIPLTKPSVRTSLFASVLAGAAALTAASPADAAGLYLPDRGVRPLGRGGAFVAGADDLGAFAYNIAGTYDAGGAVLFDASWVNYTTDYTRQAIVNQVDPNTGETVGKYLQTYPSVSGSTPFLPIPTLAVSFQPHPQWVVTLGAYAPYAGLPTYPDQVNGKAAPQRYSLLSLNGSALAFIGAGAAFAPNPEWRFGIEAGVLAGTFQSTVAFSGCVPEKFLCATEDPQWDVLAELKAVPIVAPTGQIGAQWIPSPKIRAGLSFQLPVFVRAGATIRTRLPATPVFEKASQQGDAADIAFDLPWSLRAGVELRLLENLRVEVGGGYDAWSMHDKIHVAAKGVALKNIAAFPETYYIPPIDLPRKFQDTFSVRAGGEYTLSLAGLRWEGRAGIAYESSAVPTDYLHVLTLDADKIVPSVGVSVHFGKLRLDAVYAHVIMFDRQVDPATAKIAQVSPVVANPPAQPDYVNGGLYSARADIVGLGLTYQFGAVPKEFAAPEKAAPEKAAPEKKDEATERKE
ncbi:MAG: outer membrane protein transport protein [Polyangiaceae bacterium]